MVDFIRKVFKWFAALVVAYFLLGCIALLFFGSMIAALQPPPFRIEDNSILVLDLSVSIPDSPEDADPFTVITDLMAGDQQARISLWETLEAIRRAKDDQRIRALYLEGDLMGNAASLASIRELREAIASFRESGKKVIAYLEFDSARELYLKSAADELIMNPSGAMVFKGFAVERTYLGEALDRLGVGIQVVSAGRYKSAAENFIRKDMSANDREQLQALIDELWHRMRDETAADLGLEPEVLQKLADSRMVLLPEDLLEAGMVNALYTPAEMREYLISLSDYDAEADSYQAVSAVDYVGTAERSNLAQLSDERPVVAIIHAEGVIGLGEGGDGVIGAHDLARRLRDLGEDEDVRAVVLRVNSPGGGSFASNLIYREVSRLNASKPVVVSMGGMAASGGYYIACGTDTFFVDPMTITGSIGVVGMYPNVEELANRYGIYWDGVKTTRYSDAWTIARPKNESEMALLRSFIDGEYDTFLRIVAEARGVAVEQVAPLAEGRVWTGEAALERGLVDQFGGLRDAVRHAAAQAGIENSYRVIQSPESKPLEERILELLQAHAPVRLESVASGPIGRVVERAYARVEALMRAEDPRGAYAIAPFFLDID